MIGMLIGALARGAAFGAGAGAGAQYVANHSGPRVTVPYWQGTVNGVTLALQVSRWHTQISYELAVIADGVSHPAGSFWSYPQALAAIQSWEAYLTQGGTVYGWLAEGTRQRVIEV